MKSNILIRTTFFSVRIGLGEFCENLNKIIIDYYFVDLLSFLFLVKRALKVKWQEKSELIGKLEKEVINMRNNFKEKEKTLIEERDKAVNAAE